MPLLALERYEALVGTEIGLSDWIDMPQARIDGFADCTGDHQYIHTDPDAAAASPFGGTIAHGFLTLSMLPAMTRDLPRIAGSGMAVNYGLDRVRFVAPVPSGARIRGRFVLEAVDRIAPGQVQTTTGVTVEIEGQERPALVATWLGRIYLAPAD